MPDPAHLQSSHPKHVIFVGGGSGGHIFPGIAIANELRALCAQHKLPVPNVQFVCSQRQIDRMILTQAGETFVASPAQPLLKSPKGLARFAISLFKARSHAQNILKQARCSPNEIRVVALGGFVAPPMVGAARAIGAPVIMVNLDAVPGKANRLIARKATRIFTAARLARPVNSKVRWEEIPPVVRSAARSTLSKTECLQQLGLAPDRPVLMITGGSQGLRSLNEFVLALAESRLGQQTLTRTASTTPGSNGGWQILHQTGRGFDDAIRERYQRTNINAHVVPFCDTISTWWCASDLCICTAGAGNVAEAWLNGVPSLMLPYPYHADEHQKFNAAPLVEAGGCVLGKDLIDPQRSLAHNLPLVEPLLLSADTRDNMRAKLRSLGDVDGARRVALALLDFPQP